VSNADGGSVGCVEGGNEGSANSAPAGRGSVTILFS
jgi:hypothetical protein